MDFATRIRFVLVNTSHPGNIGAAARAMLTMGLGRLVLVAPQFYPNNEATSMASGADAVLDAAAICPDLPTAVADCHLVLGCTARRRGVPLPEMLPHEAMAHAATVARQQREVAVVFGNERIGLTNDELKRCHAAVHIPSNAEFASLNLAAAVQVLAYELRLAGLAESPLSTAPRKDPPATVLEMEGFFGHLHSALADIDFFKGRAPFTLMQRLRRLFLRADLDQREVKLLRGILADAQRMARLAGGDVDH